MVQQTVATTNTKGFDGQSSNQSPVRERAAAGWLSKLALNSATLPFLLSEKQGAELGGISVRKFHELRVAGLIPEARVLGPRLLKWPRAELEQAYLDMPRQRLAGAEPLQLAKARAARSGTTEVKS